ncbi:MAG: PQQ-binding-like beta-propeller repeat protein [Propionibacteriales bacterium]|nr:PQQ-binding-like beta-propeller repeat protein [Propionibacteriales bacterium]
MIVVLAAAGGLVALRLAGDSEQVSPSELATSADLWPAPNQNLASTRAVGESEIDSSTVSDLAPAWRFRIPGKPGESGLLASNPLVVGGRAYVQDLNSNVYAFDLGSGSVVWRWRRGAPNSGPNGLGFGYGKVFGATDTTAFALDADTGELLWRRRLVSPTEQFVQIAPVVSDGLVYTSTVGFPPGGSGAIYALDADDGTIAWRQSTIRDPWRFPNLAGGGGSWSPFSVDGEGRVYAGTSNPGPWGGTRQRPNGGAYPGPVPYTSSLMTMDGRSGELLWYDQVTPHDVRDYDFQLSPILTTADTPEGERELVVGAGKAGQVIAWDRETRERLWETEVGRHRNDTGPLPRREVTICPGLLGGVETPMAHSDGRVFVPVIDLCARGSATSYDGLADLDITNGRGRLVALDAATGEPIWERRLASPAFGCATVASDVVFTVTYDGVVHAFRAEDGARLWKARLRAGSNSCPAVAGDTLLVGAGVTWNPAIARPRPELVAFRLGG